MRVMDTKRNMYITLEGIDGTGKTTLSKNLAKLINAEWFCEPDNSDEISKQIREWCLHEDHENDVPEQMREYLLMASRAYVLNKVKKILPHKPVVIDRSFISGMAYAIVLRNLSPANWYEIGHMGILEYPDLIVYVESDTQKLREVKGDINDKKDKKFFADVKNAFEDALEYTENCLGLNVVRFKQDFDVSPEDNARKLFIAVKGQLQHFSNLQH